MNPSIQKLNIFTALAHRAPAECQSDGNFKFHTIDILGDFFIVQNKTSLKRG